PAIMIAMCKSMQVSPTVRYRARTISGRPLEKRDIHAGIVADEFARGDLIFDPRFHAQHASAQPDERRPGKRNLCKHVAKTQRAKNRRPCERACGRQYRDEAKAVSLDVELQAVDGPSPEVLRMRMIEPRTVGREQQRPSWDEHAARLAQIDADVPDVLQHLERYDHVGARVR